MIKKEISEVKKLFTLSHCAVTRICGCYVDSEKNQRMNTKGAFLSLPEEEIHKYLNIFQKSLSGAIGKNIMNMEFPLEQELEEGTQKFFLNIRDSGLKDEALLEEFYQRVMETYIYAENYYIILIHGTYDVPGRASDNLDMEDSSDYVYNFILCSICPVKLSKPGLMYNSETNHMENRIQDWFVEVPNNAFLFPAFNDRNTDIHNLLYYAKNPEILQTDFVEQFLGCQSLLSAKTQKETFQSLIEETLDNTCSFETVMSIHENLNELIEERKEEPEPVTLNKQEVKKLFADSGVENAKLDEFDNHYDTLVDEKTCFIASNLVNIRSYEIKTTDVLIKVASDKAQLVKTRMIDGVPYIMIQAMDLVEINGITVRMPYSDK